MGDTLFIGHSLVGQDMPFMFNFFTQSQGLDMQADAQVINGAPLRYNWDNGGEAEGVNARAVLPGGDYDTVIVTEAIPLDDQIRENDTEGYAARYYDLAYTANPDAQLYVYETWHEIGRDTQAWRAQIAEDLPKWQGIADHVNDTAPAGAPEALVIPAGQAMARLHDRIEAGDVPGVDSIRALFADDIHLNDTGNWFVAALQFSAVTGADPARLPLETTDIWGGPYAAPDAALADVMAEVIAITLDDFLPDSGMPATGVMPPPQPIEDPDDPQDTPIQGQEINGNGRDNLLSGAAGDDTINGGRGDDTLYGRDGNDDLRGGAGDDMLFGGDGDDMLRAGAGADTVSGGDGNDVFVLSGVPGAVLITDFGANGARDMIDLSAIGGYDSLADVARVASFAGADTVLTFDLPDGVLTVTVQSAAPLGSADFGLRADPNGPSELVPVADPVTPVDPDGLTYSLDGIDSGHFVVDPATGAIDNQPWFTPSYDRVWDANGDRIFEVELVASNTAGAEVSRAFLELEVTPDGAIWREAGEEETDAGPVDPADPQPDMPREDMGDQTPPGGPVEPIGDSIFSLEGPDAYHFVVDPQSGEIDNVSWFEPSYDRVWDTNGDRIYEVARVETGADGQEVSRSNLELETTPDGPVWRETGSEGGAEPPPQTIAPVEPIDTDASFFLDGPDAYHFVVDPDTGEIGNVSWFEPAYDQIWDTNGDRVYEVERFALDDFGTEVSREALEMEVTPDGVIWRDASASGEDTTGAAILRALALPPAEDKDLPPEPKDDGEEVLLFD